MMRTLPALAALAAIAGCAPTPPPQTAMAAPPPESQCFWANAVTSFTAVDSRTVHLRVGVNDVYRLDLLGSCPDVDWNQTIALESRGGSHICTGLDATIISPSAIGPQRCAVRSVRKLTPAEVAALPPKQKP